MLDLKIFRILEFSFFMLHILVIISKAFDANYVLISSDITVNIKKHKLQNAFEKIFFKLLTATYDLFSKQLIDINFKNVHSKQTMSIKFPA